MTRQHKPTSKQGEAHIAPFKKSHKEKIKDGLKQLKVGGTHEELALVTGLRPDQVWKRLSELCNDGDLFDTGITRKLKSGVQGIVWQLSGEKIVDTTNPRTTLEKNASKVLEQLSLYKTI